MAGSHTYVAVSCQHAVRIHHIYHIADEWPQSETLLARQV